MSTVVLLAVNAKYVHSSLSVWVLAAGVKKYARSPHDVRVVEATINQHIDHMADSVAEHAPDVVGISSYIWNAGLLPELLRLLRKRLPGAVFILGGPEASYNADYWLDCGADHVLCGEGERSLPVLLDALVDNETLVPAESVDPDDPVDPYSDLYFSALNGRISYLETSRGCPFRCAFCLSADSGVRFFPLDIVKEQIRKLSLSGTHTIKFVDRTFNCNADRAFELFEFILGLDSACCFHFEAAADLFDERTLSLLASAPPGRIQFEIGLQSFHEPALNASFRQTDLEKAERNILTLLQAQNIHVHIDLIAGLPYETLSDFQQGFNRAYLLGAHTLQLGFLKLLHGSVLRKQADELGVEYRPEPPYEIKSSPWLSEDDLYILKQTENALQHTYNKSRFITTLEYVLSVSGLSPFSLMNALGTAALNHGTQLEDYISQVYDFCAGLPGVDSNTLRDHIIYDWLCMVKGKNIPAFLKNRDKQYAPIIEEVQKLLGRKIRRDECAVLSSGKGIYVDSNDRDPVTGLYRVHFLE